MVTDRVIAGLGACVLLLAASQIVAAGAVTKADVDAALPKLESYIREKMDAGAVPGLSVAIVFNDQVVYLKGFGVREVGRPDPVDADTVFQIASLSKPVSSSIVAAIVSDGTVTWDTRIADIDPSFQLFDAYPTAEVTIRDLFAHRSGLPGNAGNDLEALGYDRDTILHRLRLVRPWVSFRGGYAYSNFGLTEGGVAAAKAAGMSWEDAAEAKLFKPLGMTGTTTRYADYLAAENKAVLHVRYDGKWQALAKRMPDAQAPAGGINSTARDLAEWMRLELADGKYDGKQLIAAGAIEATHTPVMSRGIHPITGLPNFYALGWGVSYGPHGVVWDHAGAFSNGARTFVRLIPSEQLGIVVLANAFPTGMPEAVSETFYDLVFDGKSTRDWLADWNALYESMAGPANEAAMTTFGNPPASPSPALPLSAYVGTYANDYFGEATVAEADGGLTVKLGPGGKNARPLKHFDRDIFLYYPYAEAPDVPVPATFEIGPDRKATQVFFDDLNDTGFGAFPRVPE